MAKDASLSQDTYRFMMFASFGSMAAAVIHGIALLLFAYIEAYALAYFNILSVTMYVAIPVFLKRTRRVKFTYSIINIEIGAHAYLSSIYLGWEQGFIIGFC